jgi:S1-C subfamily serine protease
MSSLNFTSSNGEASIEVEWQVYERRSRSVVLTVTSGGTARTDTGPEQGIQAYYEAFAAAVRNLLAEPRFAALLSRRPSEPGPTMATLAIVVPELRGTASASKMVEHVRNAVVTIPIGSGHGSGVLISTAGLVLTNAHVVGEGSGMVTVELATGRRVVGEVVRFNRDVDVALIRLEKDRYLAAPVGTATGLRVGDPVFAIGAPLDARLSRTVTRGIVSGFREVEGQRLIQSDVTVHRGNSGGPVLDGAGRVVGVVSSGIVAGGVGVGLNFFIPIDEVWRVLGLQVQRAPVTLADLLAGRP